MESIASLYSQTIDYFRKLISALKADDCLAVRRQRVDLNELSHDFLRFHVWGSNLRANLQERARGSLDDTLRHHDVFKSIIQEALEDLRELIIIGA
jgi:hypothetical protein